MRGNLRLSSGQKLISPKGCSTRPTSSRVREAVMNLLGNNLQGNYWLDLFSGSGIMGCEAIIKGVEKVVAIEKDKDTAKICKLNFERIITQIKLKNNKVKVIQGEVISFLKKGPNLKSAQLKSNGIDFKFNLVYLDPPYMSNIYELVLENLLKKNWLKTNPIVICEHSSKLEIKAPKPWIELDHRIYGESAILMLTLPKDHFYDIDSKQPQKGLKEL